jgi:hypothetical protein
LPTDNKGYTWTGTTFKSGGTVTIAGGGDMTNCSISKTTSTNAALSITANGTTLDGTSITVADTSITTSYHLSLGASVTAITLNGVTFSGTPGTDKIYSALASGTLTITVDGTGTALAASDVTFVGGSTAVAVIAAPALYQEVVITGFVAGSRIQIYDTDYEYTVSGVTVAPTAGAVYTDGYKNFTVISSSITLGSGTINTYGLQAPPASGTITKVSGTGDASITYSAFADNGTELFNGTASAGNTVISGSTCTWTDNVAAAATRYIRVRISYVSGATAQNFIEAIIGTTGVTSGTESVSYLAAPTDNDVYNTNGIDGPAVYGTSGITFTDSSTDLVNCNIAGGSVTYPTIYACFVHWLNTATGIADDIAYITAPDTANYIFTRMKIKNTTSPVVALSVTGGWGRDLDTGLSITLWDSTGGAVGFSADHAVPYSSGSGLTAGQDATLTAIKSATDTYLDAAVSAVPDAVHDEVIENSKTFRQITRIAAAALAGKVSGAGTGTETFKGLDGSTDRIVSTVDSNGNRTAVTVDGA